uniref:Thioredoxin domain-containing protein 5 n=1 Tax=Lygus hesperus TaxID=30085 RepID=A0A0A9XS29_LYGHE
MGPIFQLFAVLLLSNAVFCDEEESKCVEYNTQTFAENINLNNHFVMFYAPWCSHCKRLHPTWDELAEMLNTEESRITIAKVDCTVETTICSEQDITGYPTLKYFSVDKLEPVKFKGTRDLPSLTNFLNEQLGSNLVKHDEEEAELDKGALVLTDDTFGPQLQSGTHFVKFYAPWCGHCQRLAPTWETFATKYKSNKGVTIAKVDCTTDREACNAYNIKSFPTLLWIQDGEMVEKYQGARSLDDLSHYVEDRLGGADYEKLEIEIPPSSPVVTLTSDNFDAGVSNGLTFVKFFAPWCGHCKGLAPTWEVLGKKFSSYKKVSIAKVDCTLEANKQLCNDQEVDGFPTLLLYKDGEKIDEHTGSRSFEDLYDFVVSHGKRLDHDEL